MEQNSNGDKVFQFTAFKHHATDMPNLLHPVYVQHTWLTYNYNLRP
jgi:hypothetical protein